MPTPTKGHRLGSGPAHERLMLANLATSLFEHDRITTTEAKAKRLRPLAERLITFAKRGDLHARRQVMTVVRDKDVVHKLFAAIESQGIVEADDVDEAVEADEGIDGLLEADATETEAEADVDTAEADTAETETETDEDKAKGDD